MNDLGSKKSGKVYLVGAGPGDPGLITAKGLRYLESADVIVHDRLVDQRILSMANSEAEIIDVGKVPGAPLNTQANINRLLIDRAVLGKQVVRLKGGDPFVFGRGGEEAQALSVAGITFEVVPGITSAIAALAYAGIPVTHRGYSSSFTVVTGNESPDKPDRTIDWDNLAKANGTIIVLMGLDKLDSIVAKFKDIGRSLDTPIALIQWGSEPYQLTVSGTISNIVEKVNIAGLVAPVVMVIGEVVKLRDEISWFDIKPMFGKKILVTRALGQASVLSDMLSNEGAYPVIIPTIEIQPLSDYTELDSALLKLENYNWIIFTSVNAVRTFFNRLDHLGFDTRKFHAIRVAAIGKNTAYTLQGYGIVPDFVPEKFTSETIVDGLKRTGCRINSVLLPGTDIRQNTILDSLSILGAKIHEVTTYRTTLSVGSRNRLIEVLSEGIDVVTFTSSSTVNNLMTLLKQDISQLKESKVACIGPITAETARDHGLKVHIVSKEHTVPGLVNAIKAYFSERLHDDA